MDSQHSLCYLWHAGSFRQWLEQSCESDFIWCLITLLQTCQLGVQNINQNPQTQNRSESGSEDEAWCFSCENRPNFPTFDCFGLYQSDLLVTKVKGLLAPVPVQLQDGDDVPDGSEDG